MTSAISDFDESAFINYVIHRYLSNDESSNNDIFKECFKSKYPTDEICENIRLKFYTDEKYNSMSLYNILYDKVDNILYDIENSYNEYPIIDDYNDY